MPSARRIPSKTQSKLPWAEPDQCVAPAEELAEDVADSAAETEVVPNDIPVEAAACAAEPAAGGTPIATLGVPNNSAVGAAASSGESAAGVAQQHESQGQDNPGVPQDRQPDEDSGGTLLEGEAEGILAGLFGVREDFQSALAVPTAAVDAAVKPDGQEASGAPAPEPHDELPNSQEGFPLCKFCQDDVERHGQRSATLHCPMVTSFPRLHQRLIPMGSWVGR